MQTIQILGIELKDRTKWESLGMAERFLRNRALRVVLYVTGKELYQASENPKLKDFIENADLTLWSTTDLIQVAGLKNDKRHREIENREFLRELLCRLAKNHLAIALVSDSDEKAEQLKNELLSMQEKLSIVSCQGINVSGAGVEQDVNRLNGVTPAIVIARFPIPDQYAWLSDAKHMMNTGIWLALPEDMILDAQSASLVKRIRHKIRNLFFKKKAMKYKNH